jgi:hypothetical protein
LSPSKINELCNKLHSWSSSLRSDFHHSTSVAISDAVRSANAACKEDSSASSAVDLCRVVCCGLGCWNVGRVDDSIVGSHIVKDASSVVAVTEPWLSFPLHLSSSVFVVDWLSLARVSRIISLLVVGACTVVTCVAMHEVRVSLYSWL